MIAKLTKLTVESILQTILWSIVTGVLYTAALTVLFQVAFPHQANGSLVMRGTNIIGSEWLAQQFQGSNYFWPRPSACTYGTSPSGIVASSGSNLGPTSGQLQTNVQNNASAFISGNNLPTNTVVPPDMVFASASGLDPDISPEAAQLQIARVALSRGMSADKVKDLVAQFTKRPQWGIFGQARVNVLMLNVALDDLAKSGPSKTEAQGNSVALNH